MLQAIILISTNSQAENTASTLIIAAIACGLELLSGIAGIEYYSDTGHIKKATAVFAVVIFIYLIFDIIYAANGGQYYNAQSIVNFIFAIIINACYVLGYFFTRRTRGE